MDYKALIKRVEYQAGTVRGMNCATMTAEEFEKAATAIETLLAEREAAIAELERIAEFCETEFLGYLDNTIHRECGYEYYCQLFDLLGQVTQWEYDDQWRGPQGGNDHENH